MRYYGKGEPSPGPLYLWFDPELSFEVVVKTFSSSSTVSSLRSWPDAKDQIAPPT